MDFTSESYSSYVFISFILHMCMYVYVYMHVVSIDMYVRMYVCMHACMYVVSIDRCTYYTVYVKQLSKK